MALKPTTATVPAQTTGASVAASDRPLPTNYVNPALVNKLIAEALGLPVEKVQGIRLYMTAAVKLSEVVVQYVRRWLENPACAAASNRACPTLDQLLAPPEGIVIRVVRGWKDGKPITQDVIAAKELQFRMKDLYANLLVPVKGNTKVEFQVALPLLNKDKNPAAKALVESVKALHRGMSGLPTISVTPELVGEDESVLVAKWSQARIAK